MRSPRPKTCRQCGTDFYARTLGPRLCSPKCAAEWRKRNRVIIQCKHCRSRYSVPQNLAEKKVFCSRRCKGLSSRVDLKCKCFGCGKDFVTKPHLKHHARIYCSKECKWKYTRGERHPMWRGGTSHFRGPGWQTISKKVREEEKNTCLRCGHIGRKGEKMHVDHIFPYRVVLFWIKQRALPPNADPNTRDNLMVLCVSCHAKKTAIELAIFKGDMYKFATEHVKFLPREKMLKAFSNVGVAMLGER